jgi:hypothetical protein
MNPKKLRKIKQELKAINRNPRGRSYRELVALAEKLERKLVGTGKHPTYVRGADPTLTPPLSIPSHPGDMAIGTVKEIVDILLSDVDVWEIHLMEGEAEGED